METLSRLLNGDPVSWLLEENDPAVRHLALRLLLDLPAHDSDVRFAQDAAMRSEPILSILDRQHPTGFWAKPGPGYSPKYRGTVWQLIFLDQLGADPDDARVRAGCNYVLAHSQAENGGFGMSGQRSGIPSPPSVVHCLNGNLLRALLGFGWIEDDRVQRAIAWQAGAITGGETCPYEPNGTNGPGFACAINEGLPCAWGAVKALRGLARVPAVHRGPTVQRAITLGVEFLLGVDPATAHYPAGWGNSKPSPLWFKLGFPSTYAADVLQVMEVLCELGSGGDPRMKNAIDWLLRKQDSRGRWRNENAYRGRTWIDMDSARQPSKWVTLRACTALKAVFA